MRVLCDSEPEFPAQKVAKVVHPPTDPDLEQLVTRMGAGDREAVAAFLTKYGELIRRRVRGKLQASVRRLFDTQDILSTLSRRLDAYVLQQKFSPRSEDEFWSLVFQVAQNSMAEKARIVEALHGKEGEDSEFAGWMLGKLKHAERNAAGIRGDTASELAFDEMIAHLKSEEDRTIATLWALGVPYVQIAEQVGLSYDVVRQRWHRIREFLRTQLKDQDR